MPLKARSRDLLPYLIAFTAGSFSQSGGLSICLGEFWIDLVASFENAIPQRVKMILVLDNELLNKCFDKTEAKLGKHDFVFSDRRCFTQISCELAAVITLDRVNSFLLKSNKKCLIFRSPFSQKVH
jgi:hypothetical protein